MAIHTNTTSFKTEVHFHGVVYKFMFGDHHARAIRFLEVLEDPSVTVEHVEVEAPLYFDTLGFEDDCLNVK